MGSNLTCQKDSLIGFIGLLIQEQREKQCCHKTSTEEGGRDKNPGITALPLRKSTSESGEDFTGFLWCLLYSQILSHSDRRVLSCSTFHLVPSPMKAMATGIYCDQWENICFQVAQIIGGGGEGKRRKKRREGGGKEEEERRRGTKGRWGRRIGKRGRRRGGKGINIRCFSQQSTCFASTSSIPRTHITKINK